MSVSKYSIFDGMSMAQSSGATLAYKMDNFNWLECIVFRNNTGCSTDI